MPRATFAANMARGTPRGSFPRFLYGEQSYWTIAGVSGDTSRVLLNTDGTVESGRGAFSIEPFVLDGSRLTTWADVTALPSLEDGDLPIPSVRWETGALALTVTAFSEGPAGSSTAFARYTIENRSRGRRSMSLVLALRPFQVNPPWQFLNTPGGVAPIDSIRFASGIVTVNGTQRVVPLSAPTSFGAASFEREKYNAFYSHEAATPTRRYNGAATIDLVYPPD